MDRKDLTSWLAGPRAASGEAAAALGYPGQRLGRPAAGPGSVAPFGRRIAAILIDWLLCLAIARGLLGMHPLLPLLVLYVEHTLLVGTIGSSLGHRLLGLRVSLVRGGPPGLRRAALRALLLCLALPPLVWDRDGRGLHDRAADTLVERL